MLSDATIKRIRELQLKVEEVMQIFDVPVDRAWLIMTCSDADKAAQIAEAIDRRQEKLARAELRSLAARAAVFKSNVDSDST